jgi:hypothetical protein
MSKKHHGGPGPVPAGNRSNKGVARTEDEDAASVPDADENRGQPDSDHDPKRGIGNYEGKGEHARQQPGSLNDN